MHSNLSNGLFSRFRLTQTVMVILSWLGVETNYIHAQVAKSTSPFGVDMPVVKTCFEYDVTVQKNGGSIPGGIYCSLSKDGKLALINDPMEQKLFMVDTSNFNSEELRLKKPVFSAWFDSESEWVYSCTYKKQTGDFSNDRVQPNLTLRCFSNFEDFKRDQVLWESDNLGSTVWWIPGRREGVRLFQSSTSKLCTAWIVDRDGKERSRHEIKGHVVGVDGDEREITALHVVGPLSRRVLQKTVLSSNVDSAPGHTSIGPFPNAGGHQLNGNWYSIIHGSRFFRLRGLQQGDVTYYFSKLAINPNYYSYADLSSSGLDLSSLLTRTHLNKLSYRWANLNRSAAAMNPSSFEVVNPFSPEETHFSFLANHEREFIPLPCGRIDDAVFSQDRSILIGCSSKGSPTKETISILTLEKPGMESNATP